MNDIKSQIIRENRVQNVESIALAKCVVDSCAIRDAQCDVDYLTTSDINDIIYDICVN